MAKENWSDGVSAKLIFIKAWKRALKRNSVCRGKKTTMKEITSGFHYIISLRLLIKYITCFSAIPVILHKCVIWLPFIMFNCSMLQQCHREYLLWAEYLVKIFGKIPKAFPYPWPLWVSTSFSGYASPWRVGRKQLPSRHRTDSMFPFPFFLLQVRVN